MSAPQEEEIRHGHRGWILADFEWSEATGRGRFVYRRDHERRIVMRNQPTLPHHEGWVEPQPN